MKTVKTVTTMGIALLCKMLVGLIAVKLCAKYVGIENFGLTGQISSLIAIVTLLASGGVAVGLAKVCSENDGDRTTIAEWVGAGSMLCVIASTLLILVFFAGRTYIEDVVLGKSIYAKAVFFVVVLSVIPIGLSGISQGVINGSQKSGTYARSLVMGSIAGLGGFLLFSYLFGAKGAMLGIIWLPVAQSLAFMISGRGLLPLTGKFAPASVTLEKTRYLGKFGLLSIAAGATIPIAYIFVRLVVQANAGAENLSLWQATVRLSEAYTQLPMLMLSVVFFVRFSSQSKKNIDWNEVRKTYLFIAALMVAIGIVVYIFREFLVKILFTPEFSKVSDLFLWQVAGDLLRMLSYVGTTILAARGFVKLGILAEVVQGTLFTLSSVVIVPMFGILGPFIAYITTYGIYFIFTISALIYLQAKTKKMYALINC